MNEKQLLEVLALSPNATAVYTAENLIIETANDAMLALWGRDRSAIGKELAYVLPEVVEQEFIDILLKVWRTGNTYEAKNVKADLLIDGILQSYYFDFIYRAIIGSDGETSCILHTANEVTDRLFKQKALEAAQEKAIALLREQELNEQLATSNEELNATNDELQYSQHQLAELNLVLEQRVTDRISQIQLLNEELASTNQELEVYNESQIILNNELFKLNQQLFDSQEDMELIINSASLAIFDYNPITGLFKGNELLKEWFGLERTEDVNLEIATNVIADRDRDRVIDAIQKSMNPASNGNYSARYTIQNPKTSELRTVLATGKAVFDEKNQPIRLRGILQDITEQAKDEQRKNDFIGMVSHELKTPITSIKAYIQLLQMRMIKPEESFVKGTLDKVLTQVNKMTTMINGFLNMSRLESGKIHIDLQQFRLSELLGEIKEEVETTIHSHKFNFDYDNELSITADRDKISQVIMNLISNAVKYSDQKTTVKIIARENNQKISVCVEDQGMGIDPKDINKLFERFYRAENQNIATISGFGIGLYLSAEIIERHKGSILVESELGKGSKFCFVLPSDF